MSQKVDEKSQVLPTFFTLRPMAQPPMDQCVQFFCWLWGRCMSKSSQNFTRIRRSMWTQRSKNRYFDGGVAVAASNFSAPCGPILAIFWGILGEVHVKKTSKFYQNLTKCASTGAEKPEKHYSWFCTLIKTLICPDDSRVVYDLSNFSLKLRRSC